MNATEIHTSLLTISATKEDARRFLRVIKEYLEQRFFTGSTASFSEYLDQKVVSILDKKSLLNLPKDFFDFFTKNNFYDILTKVSSSLEKDPIVTVYIPVTIDINDREKLGKWFKDNLSPTALLDLKVDEKLIGGISFVWKGIKHEYSFKKMVEKKKDQILEIMDTIGNKFKPEAPPETQK